MPKPAHTRVTVEGHFGESATAVVERWSFSINSPDDAAISAASDSVLDTKAEGVYNGFLANVMTPIMPANVWASRVTVAAIGSDGLYRTRSDGSYIKGVHEAINPGGQAANGMPLQIALCVSLVTSRSGPTGKGRFYLPWPALSISTADRRVPASQITDVLDNLAAFIGDYNDQAGLNASVVSSKGYSSDVTGLRVGRMPDTIRSRREEPEEGYLTVSVPQ